MAEVQVETVTIGSVFIVTGTKDDAERAAIRAEIEKAAQHPYFGVIFGDAATVLAAPEIEAMLKATMGDTVRQQLIATARDEARQEAGTIATIVATEIRDGSQNVEVAPAPPVAARPRKAAKKG